MREEGTVQRLVIRDARVVDGTGRDPVAGRDVIVEEGRIAAIQATGSPFRAVTVVDANGATCSLA